MLFKPKGKSMKFRLANLEVEQHAEIQELVEKNGGVICDESKIIFTDRTTYDGNEDVFDINYIRECIRCEQLLELIDFKIGHKGLLGCLMNIFMNDTKYCSNTTSCSNCSQSDSCVSRSLVIINDKYNEHNYMRPFTDERTLTRERTNQKHNSYAPGEAVTPPVEGMNGTQFSDSRYLSDDAENIGFTQSECSDKDRDADRNRTSRVDGQKATLENSSIEPSLKSKSDKWYSLDSIIATLPLSAAEEVAEGGFHEDANDLSELRNTSKSRNICAVEEQEPVAGPSRVIETVPVLRDRSTETRVIANAMNGSSRDMSYVELSSDSDATIYVQWRHSAEKMEKQRQRRFFPSSKTKSKKLCSPDQEKPGPRKGNLVLTRSNDDPSSNQTVLSISSDSDIVSEQPVRQKIFQKKKAKQPSCGNKKNQVTCTKFTDDKSSSDDNSDPRTRRPAEPPVNDRKKRRLNILRNFSAWEQKEMINYLINTDCIGEAKGNGVWKQMIHDGHLTHRTYQSLHNHFRRAILPNLKRFNMNPKSRRQFEKLRS